MNLIYRSELTREEEDQLRNQNIDLDDWNYMIFIPMEEMGETGEDDGSTVWRPKEYYIERIITTAGHYEAKWYIDIKFNGGIYGLGVQHH